MSNKVSMKDIVNLSQNRGFVYQGSEIYGGLANSWDYGPYGSLLKENIKNLWIKEFVQKKTDMMLLDAAILMNPQVWVTSGHVGGFSDPLMDCKSCKSRHRADKLIEDDFAKKGIDKVADGMSKEDMQEYIVKNSIVCPDCGKSDFTEIKQFNLMFKTHQGVTDDTGSEVYLRPETAQGIFVNFANIARSSRRKIPFGVAQVGKSFRNEITPGNFIFRTREFEQMEIEYFCEPGTELKYMDEWKDACDSFLVNTLGLNKDKLRFRKHTDDELSHYSNGTYDIEFKYPFGWGELRGIASRTNFDLNAHMKESKQDLSYFDPVNNKKYIPYVIEPAVGLTRLVLAVLIDAYTVDEENNRTYLKFEPRVAPIKIGVLPIVKKIGDLGKKIYAQLSDEFVCEYDEVGSIGKRFARMDEIGVPFCISIDSTNYDEGKVTVRYRDSMEQELIEITKLNDFFREKLR
ncbi:MAG: glycine--tRNA ligase [Candidatus Gracilibacteria bacterium]